MKNWEEGPDQLDKWKLLERLLMNASLRIWVMWDESIHGIKALEGVIQYGKGLIVRWLPQIGLRSFWQQKWCTLNVAFRIISHWSFFQKGSR